MKKIVVFDFDGTLTLTKKNSNSWYDIWEYLDAIEEDEILYNKYKSGEFDYKRWLIECINAYKKHNLTESTIKYLANKINLINDIKYVFKLLNKLNIKIYVLSQGVKNIINIVLADVLKYITDIEGVNFNFDIQGNLESADYKVEDKQEYIYEIIKNEKCKAEDILFIGNGKNDETIYKTGVETLCLNADDADYNNKKYWTNHIETDTLIEILKYVFNEKIDIKQIN